MAKSDLIKAEAVVVEAKPNATFIVNLVSDEGKDMKMLASLSGKMRMNFIRIIPGDRVDVEISPYDLTRCRICFRHKN